jgi:catechol 2,3-dioxygenase-like lactoylglutathione lyase family enzyme
MRLTEGEPALSDDTSGAGRLSNRVQICFLGVNGMSMLRLDHMGIVVADLDAVVAFFLALGCEREEGGLVEGEWVDKIVGLDGVRAEIVFVRTPDGSGNLELVKYHAPADTEGDKGARPLPANRLGLRHIAFQVKDLDTIVNRLRDQGFDTVGEIREYEDNYRLCYIRGPEGLIVELAQQIASAGAS